MSEIAELLAALRAPETVDGTLGGVGTFVRGNGLQKKDLQSTGVPAIHYGQIHTHYETSASEAKSFTSAAVASKLRSAHTGDLVIATTSEDDKAVGKAVAWLGAQDAAVSGDAYIFRHDLDPKYMSYFFQSSLFQRQKRRHITGTKVRRISGEAMAKLRIPIPSIEVQRRVVAVLDSFSRLPVELRAELSRRQEQYSYYRELLLTFDETVAPRRRFGEIATVARGASPRPIQQFMTTEPDGISWIKIGDVAEGSKYVTGTSERVTVEGSRKSRLVHPGDFILSNSMSFGRPYISNIEGAVHDGWLVISGFADHLDSNYLYHLLRSVRVQSEFRKRAGAGTVSNLNADIVRAVTLPVPPISEQRRVAAFLDRFDLLVNDASFGIPAEIAARRRQFEYFRDSFFGSKEAAA